ncbi:hypothetical protein, partial [Thermaurantiacus sp.]
MEPDLVPSADRPGFLSTIVIGAVIFLFPLLLLIFLLRQGIALVEEPVARLAQFLPLVRLLGPLGDLLLASLLLLGIAWVAGLLLTTGWGRRLARRVIHSPLFSLPPLSFARGFAAGFGGDDEQVKVVLVPSDQGRTLAFLFGASEGETLCVYVPAAPNWTSGSISFARREDVEFTQLSFREATR